MLIPGKDHDLLGDVGSEVILHTYLYVRENILALYGFVNRDDRELFMRLIDVSGVGPKIAIGILSAHSADKIMVAIREKDISFLVTLPGLGRKTAERLVMELKDKLKDIQVRAAAPGGKASIREEAILALTSLGMTRVVAERALDNLNWQEMKDPSVEEVVREALKVASGI